MAGRTKAERQPKNARALTPEQEAEVMALLQSDEPPTYRELTALYGCSLNVISRLNKLVQPEGDEQTEEYGRQLTKSLPMAERVRLWAKLARGDVDPKLGFVQKAALQRVDELAGHVTAKEKRESDAKAQMPGPMIVLPPGTAMMFAPPQVVVEAEKVRPVLTSGKPEPDGSST